MATFADYIARAEPIAYGICGLDPEAFWRLTPGEFRLVIKGATERFERTQWLLAWMLAHLLNISGKQVTQNVSAAQLLGKVIARKRRPSDEEDETGG